MPAFLFLVSWVEMSEKPDWEAIRREYEVGGASLRQLAVRYGISKSTIDRHAKSERWDGTAGRDSGTGQQKDGTAGQQNISPIHILRQIPAPSPPNAVEGANLGLEDLLELMQNNKGKMGYDDHVKASNAMERYNKIIINAPPDEEHDDEQEDLSGFTEEETRIYAELQERAKRKA
jgi:hypothetical protein